MNEKNKYEGMTIREAVFNTMIVEEIKTRPFYVHLENAARNIKSEETKNTLRQAYLMAMNESIKVECELPVEPKNIKAACDAIATAGKKVRKTETKRELRDAAAILVFTGHEVNGNV